MGPLFFQHVAKRLAILRVPIKQQVVRDQPTLSPNLDRREVNGAEDIPMGLEKGLPGRFPLSFRCGFDANAG